MSQTTVTLGYVPKNRGEYVSSPETRYYKDNIVQYRGSSFIADPVGYDATTNPAAYVTGVPYTVDPAVPNAGWKLFANGGSGEAMDISKLNADTTTTPATLATYSTLALAIAAIPASYRQAGMSMKYIDSTSGNYRECRYLKTATSGADFTTTTNWIELGAESTAYLKPGDSSSTIAGFDPQADTLWKGAQVLSSAEKTQVQQNIGVYGKSEVDSILADGAFLEQGGATAVIVDFDPQVDTLWKKAQTLSNTEKEQVKTNLGLAKVASTGSYSDIANAPVNVSSFTNDAGYITLEKEEV